jgi:hypothetical protein
MRKGGGGGSAYARHMRDAVPVLMAITRPLLNPNNTWPLFDSTGCVTTVALLAELCIFPCSIINQP